MQQRPFVLENMENVERWRCLMETKMHCIQRLGERIMSKTFERQVNELHIRSAILHRFTELGRPQALPVA